MSHASSTRKSRVSEVISFSRGVCTSDRSTGTRQHQVRRAPSFGVRWTGIFFFYEYFLFLSFVSFFITMCSRPSHFKRPVRLSFFLPRDPFLSTCFFNNFFDDYRFLFHFLRKYSVFTHLSFSPFFSSLPVLLTRKLRLFSYPDCLLFWFLRRFFLQLPLRALKRFSWFFLYSIFITIIWL